MKFYVCSSLKNYKAVNKLSDSLEKLGFENTYNWAKNGMVENKDKTQLVEVSLMEHSAIVDADLVIVLLQVVEELM